MVRSLSDLGCRPRHRARHPDGHRPSGRGNGRRDALGHRRSRRRVRRADADRGHRRDLRAAANEPADDGPGRCPAGAGTRATNYPRSPTGRTPGRHPIVQIGEIRIPKIGLVHPVYEGVTLTVIDRGPGHWPGSAVPGQLGNTVFAGHRTTKSKPFRNLDLLVPGDEIIFSTKDETSTYLMTRQEIVSPKDVWIVDPTPDATVTLFACHAPGSARQRIVVRGALAATAPA